MARYQNVSTQINLAIKGTQEDVTRAIVAAAKREHAEIMNDSPRPTGFRRYVDGAQAAPLEAVKRVVLFEYQRLDVVAQFAMETLFDKSPVLSGEYRNAHTLFLNGVAVTNLKDFKAGDEIVVTNFLPYSRVIEMGKMKMRVPGTDHVYQQAAQIVKGRYGNLANVTFIPFLGVGGGRVGNKSGNRFPALSIKAR